MKKILCALSLFSIVFLTACSWMYTLDVNGNVTLTIDKIQVNVTSYEHLDGIINQSTIVTVEFTNPTDKNIAFDLSDAISFDDNGNEKYVSMTLSSLTTSVVTGELVAGKSVKYTFTIVTFTNSDNVDNYKISFMMNDTELFIKLKDQA